MSEMDKTQSQNPDNTDILERESLGRSGHLITNPSLQNDQPQEKLLDIAIQTCGNVPKKIIFERKKDSSSESIPVLFSLKCQRLPEAIQRNVDLVCVIDNSGSMNGEKISHVKKTLNLLIDSCSAKDRVSLISFDYGAERLSGLQECTEEGKAQLKKSLNNFTTRGGTNIQAGLDLATETLLERERNENITAIFLLSDGQDSIAMTTFKEALEEKGLGKNQGQKCNFIINTFGYGQDHDAGLMREIAEYKNGSYYNIEKLSKVKKSFLEALGRLRNVVAENIELEIVIESNDRKSKISKSYGNFWSPVTNGYRTNLNYLQSGENKEFMCLVEFPPESITSLKVQLFAEKHALSKSKMEYRFSFPLSSMKPRSGSVFNKIQKDLCKAEAANAIDEVIFHCEQKDYTQANEVLQKFIKSIQETPDTFLQKTLTETVPLIEKRSFNMSGRSTFHQLAHNLTYQ